MTCARVDAGDDFTIQRLVGVPMSLGTTFGEVPESSGIRASAVEPVLFEAMVGAITSGLNLTGTMVPLASLFASLGRPGFLGFFGIAILLNDDPLPSAHSSSSGTSSMLNGVGLLSSREGGVSVLCEAEDIDTPVPV